MTADKFTLWRRAICARGDHWMSGFQYVPARNRYVYRCLICDLVCWSS